MTEEEKAVELFDNHYNCAQAVYLACRDASRMPEDTAAFVSGIFGGGVGLGQTCGALCGAIMALTERFTPKDTEDASRRTHLSIMKRTFGKWFADAFGSCMCSDLRSVVPMGQSSHPLCTNFVAGCAQKINTIDVLCECSTIETGSSDYEKALALWQDALCLPSGVHQARQDACNENNIQIGLFSLGYLIGTISLEHLDDETLRIHAIMLDGNYHKTGADRVLIDFAETAARLLGYKTIHTRAYACTYTRDLYQSLGYGDAAQADDATGKPGQNMVKLLSE